VLSHNKTQSTVDVKDIALDSLTAGQESEIISKLNSKFSINVSNHQNSRITINSVLHFAVVRSKHEKIFHRNTSTKYFLHQRGLSVPLRILQLNCWSKI